MGSIDTFAEVAARAGATAVAANQRRQQSAGIAGARMGNTLQCNLDLAGSAAQSNPSVSARHSKLTRTLGTCLPQSTADTLSKG